jgi:membrane-anchored glycerophosphoryl diester phosphodiesterase (GDPDase)
MIKLIGVLVAGIPAIIAAILAQLGRKWVTVTAALALMVALTAAFIALINGFVSTLMAQAGVPGIIANAVGMFLPSNFGAVLGVIVSAHIARAAYDLAMQKAQVFASAT